MIKNNIELAGKAAEEATGTIAASSAEGFASVISQIPGERKFSHIKRLVFHYILPMTPVLTIAELVQKVEMLTDAKVTKAFLLATIVSPDSGLTIQGDLLNYTLLDQDHVRSLRYRARKIIDTAGGEIAQKILIQEIQRYFRKKHSLNIKGMPLASCLFNRRTKFLCTLTPQGGYMVSHYYTHGW